MVKQSLWHYVEEPFDFVFYCSLLYFISVGHRLLGQE